MSSAKKAASKSAAKKSSSSRGSKSKSSPQGSPTHAVRLLTADHREVKALFQQYQEFVDHEAENDEKQTLAEQICAMLTVHAQIEEEIFYPAAREALKEPDLIDEATVEHACVKELIAQLQDGDPSDELYDAKVKVLGEYVDHHVKEEEGELFAQARRAKLDMEALGRKLMERKTALMAELGLAEEGEEEEEGEEVA